MDDIRKERLVISITSLAGILCIVQNYFGGWEFWVPAVVLVGLIVLWWIHLAEKLGSHARIYIYFAYCSFLVFYLGIHETGLFDISIAIALFMTIFTVTNSTRLLNLILLLYASVMGVQFYFLYRNGEVNLNSFNTNAFNTMRVLFHVVTVIGLYFFCRITVNRRLADNARMQKWMDSVSENDHDMEDFMSNVSHELRTPVNVISGMTTLLQKNNDSEELVSIQKAGIRLAHQIEDIQDYTEIKRGELVLEQENYMCLSLVNDVVSNFRAEYGDSSLELIVDLSPDTPTLLNGDIKKLHKVLRHLLGNAHKFTKRGGVLLRVFSVPQEYGCNLMIEVMDTGIGMTRAQMSQLSKGMYQANKKRNRSTGGIGIGLPIVYGFVHKMGGFVRIDSEKGRGTKVRLSIPQTVVDPAPCLKINESNGSGSLFYIDPVKLRVPEVREFYKTMTVNLATGLKTEMYTSDNTSDLEKTVKEIDISTIFTGEEEYEADKAVLDGLSRDGYRVVVFADPGYKIDDNSAITVLPKPLYAFPVVRVLNGEYGTGENESGLKGKPRFTGVSALVVDDEPMNLVVATGLLREYKMFADTAESGREAVKKYENGEYDVIFMDHMMPEMDGVEAMKRIRQVADECGKHPIMIALTANALSGAREMFIREGFDGFIAKPIDIGDFERVMKHVLPEEMIHYEGRDA